MRERVEADRERFRLRIEAWISLVLADRSGPRLDPQVLAHALVACAEHFGRVALTDPGKFDAARLMGQVRLILGTIWPSR